jgi:hypothetical protein
VAAAEVAEIQRFAEGGLEAIDEGQARLGKPEEFHPLLATRT